MFTLLPFTDDEIIEALKRGLIASRVTYDDVPHGEPNDNDLWFDSGNKKAFIYMGGEWNEIFGKSDVYSGRTPPPEGVYQLWFDTSVFKLFGWDSYRRVWIQV